MTDLIVFVSTRVILRVVHVTCLILRTRVAVEGGEISAMFDGVKLGTIEDSCVPPNPIVFPGHGMVGLGCGAYHYCQFSSFDVKAT